MASQASLQRLVSVVLIASLLLTSAAPIAQAQSSTSTLFLPLVSSNSAASTNQPLLYRTHIRVQTTVQWRDLERMDLLILDRGAEWALVLVDDLQLADLARLRYNPNDSNALSTLANASTSAKSWNRTIRQSVRSLLAEADTVSAQLASLSAADEQQGAALRNSLRQSMRGLDREARAAVASAATVDSDGDGLSDDAEGWWCTNPAKADTDLDGVKDGAEVDALKAWLNNQTFAPPSSGKPFQGWPNPANNCYDDDRDSIPDVAEGAELGLNPNRESTDLDKFDDGQELFGFTNCPGGDNNCGYGDLPRSADAGFIGARLPAFVKAPGNHPLLAAFPKPEIDVVESSLKMSLVTTISDGQTTLTGVEKSYSTAKTEGTSTSVADTVTWNEWQELSVSKPLVLSADPQFNIIASNTADAKYDQMLMDALEDNIDCLLARPGSWKKLFVKGVLKTVSRLWDLRGCIKAAYNSTKIVVGSIVSPPIVYTGDIDPDLNGLSNEGQNGASGGGGGGGGGGAWGNEGEISDPSIQTGDSFGNEGGHYLTKDAANSNISVQAAYPIYFPLQSVPRPTQTNTIGESHGGAQTTTHTQYEEHTITNGEAFLNQESWSKTTAVDSAHTADFWFTYKVRNTGMEYAREIGNLAFNLYIGDDPNPAYTYFVAPDLGGDGKFHNFMPDEEHTYTAHHIPLTLNQMKLIDLGAPIRVVVEDFSYGSDELFYQDAAKGGVMIAIEDGTEDGDENIDNYLIPTWRSETVLQTLARYFPHQTDSNGTLIAIWTPEYRDDTPAWCQSPTRPSDYPSKAVWCKHLLSTSEWWNIYTDGLGNGSEGIQDTSSMPGAVALFRFNQDSDHDGFSDHSELRLGTDPNDASSLPHPELLAGVHTITVGSKVTTTLSLLNTGEYDAYGVEAVMVAPDDSITIDNNTVGGSGRVRAFKQVIVGSRIALQSLLNTSWASDGHAVPGAGGYYTGNEDRTYTFTVNCPLTGGCEVGKDSWTLAWNDGKGNSSSIPFGAGYKSPVFQTVGTLGLTLALYSGTVKNGESFTVQANTPRDTFQYTINRPNHTPPIVIVSYNDPQGNHRFVIPNQAMNLSSPTDNLSQFAGEMLADVGVEIVTSTPFTPSVDNRVSLLVNNPADKTLSNAHLFLEFINISGTVVSEIPLTATLAPGPTYRELSFNSANFGAGFHANEETIVMAFLTDYQGNILDTAGRPLSSFQVDPKPKLASSSNDLTWSFGTLPQGMVSKFPLSLANTGFGVLYSYLPPNNGLTLDQASQSIGAADVSQYQLTLRTADLPLGAFDRTIAIRTSDPQTPTVNLRVLGTVISAPPDTPGGTIQRPLDVSVTVTGTHSQGEWVVFTHTLAPNPQTLHPVKVLAQDYGTLLGVGKYATDFGQGTSSYDMFGDGRDGDLIIPTGSTVTINTVRTTVNASGTSATVSSSSGFVVGDLVLLHQTQGTVNVGRWEFATIASISGNTWTFTKLLQYNYSSSSSKAQAIKIPRYRNVTVQSGGTLTAPAWDGSTGGIIAFLANEAVLIAGTINAKGANGTYASGASGALGGVGIGFKGGNTVGQAGQSWQGDGTAGVGAQSYLPNGNAGGGGYAGSGDNLASGGGGGNSTSGQNGFVGGGGASKQVGLGGSAIGSADLATMVLGGGGGGSASANTSGDERGGGGAGGGIVILIGKSATVDSGGSIVANGGRGGGHWSGGGGGAGGSILFKAQMSTINGTVSADGGWGGGGGGQPRPPSAAGSFGGDGANGRIRVEYCDTFSGSTSPVASTQKLNCYIVEQIETTPYTTARLNLPAAVNGSSTYNVQFGRKLDFAAAGNQLTQLRLPAGMVGSARFNLLASGLPTTTTISIDIGDDGITDWTQAVGNNSSTPSLELADAFNDYWASHSAPSTGTIDIPLRVTSGNAGQLLLTNLQIASAASSLRSVRITARSVSQFLVDFTAGTSGQVVAALDIGDNGSIDWTTPSSEAAPKRWLTGDLKNALNQFLAGKSNDVDVPIRFYVSPLGTVKLNDFIVAYTAQQDLAADGINIHSGVLQAASPDIQEGDLISVTATLRNATSNNSGPVTAAFFANAPGWGDWYIGSAFLPNIPANSTAQVAISWNTTGFGGNVPVKVVVNPYQRIGETIFSNNTTTVTTFVTPNQISQTVDFPILGNKTINDNPFTIQAFASSGLTVSFASLTSGICTVNGSLVTLTGLAGSCTLRASQAGDLFYFAAPAVDRSFQVINPNGAQPQTINFPQPNSKVYTDTNFAITATATSGLPVLVVSQSTGVCTVNGFTVTIISAGACLLNASQAGNNNFLAAADVSRTVTIGKAQQTITFPALADKVLGDPDFTISASATSGAPVSFTTQTSNICTVNGTLVSLVAAGSCTIRATQAGTVNYNAAPPVDRSFVVNMPSDPGKTEQTISFAALGNKTYGDGLFAVSATASSGLAVSISSQTLITCTISSNVVRILTTGTCTLRAAQNGNDVYNPALPVEQSFTIFKANQTITFDGLHSMKYKDQPFTLSASSSSGLAVSFTALTGQVCSVSGSEVTLLAAGLCTIEASQAGNLNYNAAAPKAQSFIVEKADQQIHFEVASGHFLTETPVSLVATADSGLTVTFDSLTRSVCETSGNNVTLKTTGTCILSASQSGNGNFNSAATVIGSFAVSKPDIPNQLITFNPLPSRVYGDPAFTVSAVASSTLPVSFRSNTLDICTLENKTVTIISAGACIIQASQDGNESYNPAPPVERSFDVERAPQEILFDPLDNPPLGVLSITVAASATSGLPVIFTGNTPDVCAVDGITVTLLSGGICTVVASQPGNRNYLTADSVAQSFRVAGKSKQSIDVPPLEDKTFGDASFVISATATSKLTVTFQSNQPTNCSVNGNKVSILGSGLCAIAATQPGNASYEAALPVTRSFIIEKAMPIITFDPLPSHKLGDAPFTLAPISSSGLTLTLQSQTPTVCSVSGMQVALLAVGTCRLVATQVEGTNYKVVSTSQSFEVLSVTGDSDSRVFLPLVNR